MMALKHDAQGFLVGDPIDIGAALKTWEAIKDDVQAIRKAVTEGAAKVAGGFIRHSEKAIAVPVGRVASVAGSAGSSAEEADPAVKAFNRRSEQSTPVAPARRVGDDIPALLRKAVIPVREKQDKESKAAPKSGIAETVARPARKTAQAIAKPAGRDGRGRFTKGENRSGGSTPGETKDGADEGALRSIADRIVGAVADSSGGMEEADPAVKAFNEVAQPMARGYEMLTGGSEDKKQTGLLRRVFGTLDSFRKEESAFNKAANRSLKNLEAKPEGGEAGNGGFWGTILSAIMGIGPAILAGIGALLSKIPFFGPKIGGAGAGGVGTGAAGAAGGAAKAGGGFFKGALKKIPLLGSLLAVGGAAADIYGSENDDKLSRREKDKNVGKAIGGAGGTIGGMMAGAAAGAFAGPIGMAIGGMVGAFLGDQAGQIIGDAVGGWVNDLRSADIVGAITGAWDSVTSMVKSGWDSVASGFTTVSETIGKGWDAIKGGFDNLVSGIGAIWDNFSGFLKEKFGIDIPGILKPVVDAGKKVVDVAVNTAAAAKQKAVEVGTKAIEKGKEVAQATKEKAVEVGAKAVEGAKQGAEYLGNNTTIGKGVKAAGQGASVVTEKTAAAAERAYNVTAATAGSALETVMPKGYRHKALFDGIKGGDSLTKYGSYTDEEAAKIRELKTSGANTSANVKGGMSLEVQDKISAQAKKAGLDPATMRKIAAMESGGNANAISSTGAAGVYQFTGQTASGVGIKNRFDVDQNIEGGMKLTRQNQAALEKSGLPVSAENLYMMHQLGPKAAQEVIRGAADGKSKADMSPETQKAMNLNYGANSASAADYIATNKKALDDRYAAVTKGTGGAQTAIAKAQQAPTATLAAASPIQAPATVVTPAFKTAPIASPAAPVSASISAPPVSVVPKTAPIADTPPVVDTLASNAGSGRKTQAVTVAAPEAGQDLKDRRIAHIVTGGLCA